MKMKFSKSFTWKCRNCGKNIKTVYLNPNKEIVCSCGVKNWELKK